MRLGDLVGRIAKGLQLEETRAAALAARTTPTVLLGDLSEPWASDKFDIRHAHGYAVQAAGGAGTYAAVGIRNPASSGVLAVSRGFIPHVAADSFIAVVLAATSGSVTDVQSYWSDGRLPGAPACRVGRLARPAASTPQLYVPWSITVRESAAAIGSLAYPFIIPPGYYLEFQNTNANQQLIGSCKWFELDEPLIGV